MLRNVARNELRHILVIADETARIDTLQSVMRLDDLEVDSATTLDEVKSQCELPHDLAVVDVPAAQLAQVLDQLRRSPSTREIPVLVNVERTAYDTSLAGVLPRFRAMPCTTHQMGRFTKQQFAAPEPHQSEISFL